MNSEELKKEFGLLMPSEINGFKRPDESIPSSNDFFLEIPQLISKDPVLYSTMNLIFSVILSNDKLLKQWHDTLQNVVNEQDWRVVTDSIKGYMTPELKKKLDGIATGANNYVHPANHPATMITQDATHRFVTDTEKTTWNGKASTAVVSTTANGLAPKRDGNASHFLAGDGTWKTVSSVANATTASKLGTATVGSGVKPIYLNAGSPAASGSTVGSANRPIYMNGGTLSQCSIDLSTLAPKASPALTGSPTAPTQGTSDNSTKIATTAFVRNLINQFKTDGTLGGIVGGSLTQNGWVKFSNGLILQWGVGSNNMFKFPISFTKNCFCAILTRNSGAYEVALIIKSKSTSTITWESWNSNGKVDVVPAECLVVGV